MNEFKKLKGKIVEVCGSQEDFAKKMNISRVSLSKKLNSKSTFTQKEIKKACKILSINPENIKDYFF